MNDINLSVIHSSGRKSISIQIYPDCSVKMRVPKYISEKKIQEIIEQKKPWIYKKIVQISQNKKNVVSKLEYVSGDQIYYLGKQYKLDVSESKNASVTILDDIIFITKKANQDAKKIFIKWLEKNADDIFMNRLKYNFEIFSKVYNKYSFPVLKIRRMKTRWGSMSSNGNMTLNIHLLHTPIECIDYVVMHELCHLIHRNHGKQFYLTQEKFVPNYKELKKLINSFSIRNF